MRRSLILIVSLIFSIAVAQVAQGDSPVKVNKIVFTPSPFGPGNTLTFTVEIENTSNSSYGCVNDAQFSVHLRVFKSDTSEMNKLWETKQALTTPLAAGEKRTVTFTSKWTVPTEIVDTKKVIFSAQGPACFEKEFYTPQVGELTCYRSCTFAPKDFKIFVKPTKKW